MRRSIPLIEAVGLICAMVSWWFNWSSVQRWNDRIDSFSDLEYEMTIPEQLNAAKIKLEKLAEYINANSSKDVFGENHPPIFLTAKVSISDAINLYSKIRDLDNDLVDSGTALVALMQQRKNRTSAWFTVFFVIGSALAVSSKMIDYRIESKR